MKRSPHLLLRLLAVAIVVFLNTYLTAHQFFAHRHVFESHSTCSHAAHHPEELPADEDAHCELCEVDFAAFTPPELVGWGFRPNGRMGEYLVYYLAPEYAQVCAWPALRGPPMYV